MRAKTRDFWYATEKPPKEIIWLPLGLRVEEVGNLADVELDPLVRECECCPARQSCRPDAFALPECNLAASTAGRARLRAATLAALRANGPSTIYGLMSITGQRYHSLRGALKRLVAEGLVVQEGTAAKDHHNKFQQAKLYALATNDKPKERDLQDDELPSTAADGLDRREPGSCAVAADGAGRALCPGAGHRA